MNFYLLGLIILSGGIILFFIITVILKSSCNESFKSNTIPKLIHQIWLQGEESMPADIKIKVSNLRDNNPSWKHKIWSDNDIRELVQKYPDMLYIYDNIQSFKGHIGTIYSLRSDIGRCLILKEFGGIYLDADFSCIKPFDEIIDFNYSINTASSEIDFLKKMKIKSPCKYFTGFMAFSPNHKIWKEIFSKMGKSRNKRVIAEMVDSTLQKEKFDVNIIENISGPYTCKSGVCSTPTESSWNKTRLLVKNINCNFEIWIISIILFVLWSIFLILYLKFR